MSETLAFLLLGAATLAIVVMAISFILTSIRTKKMKCPQCGAKTPVAHAYHTDAATGQKIQGEPDIPFGTVAAAARILIGLIAVVYVFALLFSAIGYENCELEGINMVCSEAGSEAPGMAVNLIFSLIGIIGGVIVMFNGAVRLIRALNSRGKKMTYEYICSRNHRWTT